MRCSQFIYFIKEFKMEKNLKRLNLEYLPEGVTATLRVDYGGGYYYLFEHYILGQIGRMIVQDRGEEETCLTYEIFLEQEAIDDITLNARKNILQQIVDSSDKFFY